METLITFLNLMRDLIVGVLRLNPDVFQAVLDSSITGILALIILFLPVYPTPSGIVWFFLPTAFRATGLSLPFW